jgi:hypothetical protein
MSGQPGALRMAAERARRTTHIGHMTTGQEVMAVFLLMVQQPLRRHRVLLSASRAMLRESSSAESVAQLGADRGQGSPPGSSQQHLAGSLSADSLHRLAGGGLPGGSASAHRLAGSLSADSLHRLAGGGLPGGSASAHRLAGGGLSGSSLHHLGGVSAASSQHNIAEAAACDAV